MHTQGNSESVTLSLRVSRRGMKPVLLALAAGAVKNWEPAEIAAESVAQKMFAAIGAHEDQPPQATATAESSRAVVPASDAADPLAATLVERSAVPAVPTTAERPKTVGTAPDALAAGMFGVGDKLKVAFYERVEVEEDKWGRMSSASALRGILQRPELSGEYTVQEDGTISVPLLGSIAVANRSAQKLALRQSLAKRQSLSQVASTVAIPCLLTAVP
jgi:polysaccharide biosynthesis/export protein ExoF